LVRKTTGTTPREYTIRYKHNANKYFKNGIGLKFSYIMETGDFKMLIYLIYRLCEFINHAMPISVCLNVFHL